jgi:glucose-1-phosphate thymidylyltransferase
MLDYLYDRIAEVGEVEEVHVVTNARFAEDFRAWARTVERAVPVAVHDDGTTSNDDRLGAVGDMSFAIERGGLEGEDLLVVAGDNLIGYRLDELVSFWRGKGEGAATVHRF